MLLGNNMDASEEQVPDHQPIELLQTLSVLRNITKQLCFWTLFMGCSRDSVPIIQERRGRQNEAREGTIFPVLELATATEHCSSHLL